MAKRYRLLMPLRHKGVQYRPGEELELDDATAQWCMQNGVVSTAGGIIYPSKRIEVAPASTLPNAGRSTTKHAVRSSGCVGCGWSKK